MVVHHWSDDGMVLYHRRGLQGQVCSTSTDPPIDWAVLWFKVGFYPQKRGGLHKRGMDCSKRGCNSQINPQMWNDVWQSKSTLSRVSIISNPFQVGVLCPPSIMEDSGCCWIVFKGVFLIQVRLGRGAPHGDFLIIINTSRCSFIFSCAFPCPEELYLSCTHEIQKWAEEQKVHQGRRSLPARQQIVTNVCKPDLMHGVDHDC